ncbi:MAG: gliding motility-associated C-terminal domain-containing protein [Ferruginibacter sp.]
MQKILLVLFFFTVHVTVTAQTGFSFSCTRDTLISCSINCITLKARIPNITGPGNSYKINPISNSAGGCYAPYTDPGAPGVLTPFVDDDKYSDTIPIGFSFPFYGLIYNNVVANTNGVVTFDLSKAFQDAEYGILNNRGILSATAGRPQNLPSNLYDKSVIMGPYSDINPSAGTTVGYTLTGTAPYRRWVFSFYKIPLYNCPALIDNTYQIVLYESLGIIEVFIQDKQICKSWNDGRAMIGIQDENYSNAFMVPGRAASDRQWGGTGINESWRFVPTGGPSLLKKTELFDLGGTLISTGTTVPMRNGELDASFPNVCPLVDPATYIIKSTYQKFDDPAVDIIATDTVTVTRDANLPVAVKQNAPACFGANATLTVTDPIAPNAEYSIDGITWQASPVFTVSPNTYSVKARLNGTFCKGAVMVTVIQPGLLTLNANPANPTCSGNDGKIALTATGGTTPYQYSIDNGITYKPAALVTGLIPSAYPNIKVKDANGCMANAGTALVLNDQMFLRLGPDTAVCAGSSVTFEPQTNPETNVYKWRALNVSANTLDNDTIKNASATSLDTSQYILYSRWGVCSRQDTIRVNIKHKPLVNAGRDTMICFKTKAILHGSSSNASGPVIYSWSPNNFLNDPDTSVTILSPDTPGIYPYTLTVKDNYGCNFSVSDIAVVTVQPPVPAFAGNDTNAVKAKPHQLYGSGGSVYTWSPAGPLNNPFAQNPLATLFNDTRFYLEVKDVAGCTGYDTVFVKVYDGPAYYLPNAFSPNGDGLNDIFRAVPAGISNTQYFRIFNRLGEMVFETNQWLKGWDGTYRGKKQPIGAYIWMIKGTDRNGKVVEEKGTVMLVQ